MKKAIALLVLFERDIIKMILIFVLQQINILLRLVFISLVINNLHGSQSQQNTTNVELMVWGDRGWAGN